MAIIIKEAKRLLRQVRNRLSFDLGFPMQNLLNRSLSILLQGLCLSVPASAALSHADLWNMTEVRRHPLDFEAVGKVGRAPLVIATNEDWMNSGDVWVAPRADTATAAHATDAVKKELLIEEFFITAGVTLAGLNRIYCAVARLAAATCPVPVELIFHGGGGHASPALALAVARRHADRLVQRPEGTQCRRQIGQEKLHLRSGVGFHRRSLRRGGPDLTGPLMEYCLYILPVNFAFQGADAIGTEDKVYNLDLRLAKVARVDKLMRRVARRSCLLADHTKIGTTALARNGTLADVDIFITDTGAPAAVLKRFARLGPKIVTAAP